MSETLKFGNGIWATKKGSTLAYNSENGNFKPLPFTFDRSTSATRVNKEGLIEVVGSGEPRIDFSNDAKGALLLEPERRNLSTRSNELNLWGSKVGVAITPNYSLSPDGSINSNRLLFSANGYCHNSNSQINGTVYTISAYVKRNTGTQNVGFFVNGSGGVNYSFNLTNEWQRFEYTYTSTNASTVGFAGISGADISVYGFQFEQGSYATSYIPTQGSIGTRVAEVCNDAGNSTVFNNDTAVWFIDLERIGVDNSDIGDSLTLRDDSNVRQITLWFDAPTQQIRFRDGKNSFAQIGGVISTSLETRKKIALKIDGSTLKVFAAGNQIGSNYTKVNSFDITEIDMQGIGYKIREIKFYNTALTDQELINLTTI